MNTCLIVRAIVPADSREAFDAWYANEHLPEAHAAFGSLRAWRGWSADTPEVHFAFYEFPDLATAKAVCSGEAMASQVRTFDSRWGESVTRRREIVETSQSLG